MSDSQKPSVSVSGVLRQSFNLICANFILFFGIASVGAVFGYMDILLSVLKPDEFSLLNVFMLLLNVVWAIWASGVLVYAVWGRLQGEPVTLKTVIAKTNQRYWRYLSISIQLNLIWLLGFFLLVVPAFYWGTVYFVSYVIVLLEEKGDRGPFARSKALVAGSFWKVLALNLLLCMWFLPILFIPLLALDSLALQLVNQLFGSLWCTFATTTAVVLYRRLVELEK